MASTPARVDTRIGLVQRVSRLARGRRAAGYEGRGAGVVAEDPRWVRGFGRRRPMDGGGARVRGSGGARRGGGRRARPRTALRHAHRGGRARVPRRRRRRVASPRHRRSRVEAPGREGRGTRERVEPVDRDAAHVGADTGDAPTRVVARTPRARPARLADARAPRVDGGVMPRRL